MVATRRGAGSPKPMRPAPEMPAKPKEKKFEYEFGGPLGAAFVMLSLPLVVYGLFFACNAKFCIRDGETAAAALQQVRSSIAAATFWSWEAAAAVLGWFVLQALLFLQLPGPMVPGAVLQDGSRLTYPMNGHLAFWISLAVVCLGGTEFDADGLKALKPLPLAWCYDHYVELASASVLLSLLLAIGCYAASFRPGCMLARGGDSGNAVYDFFIGRPLNPRVGALDLKEFCELRPGLIGWAVLNLGMAAKQLQKYGAVSGSMVCVNAFQLLYVWDALYHEQAILTTMDITTDGFGYMLSFGDLAWVPFTYSLQARLLVDHDPELPGYALLLLVCLNALGYAIFRGANGQKDAFRRDPTDPAVAHLQYMETATGRRLLTSGWWGLARKINYLGDWLMSLSWCLCCGGASPIGYFYCTYFAILLIHRAARDDHMCSQKYGADWVRYKQKVPALFIPGLI
mmetsp:Transcript_14301/g.28992  ORF Transcript_14301/g.28992 Transcript_14301/m.28992 type:complete len:456 (-) Transcript_14301:156-1523(-)